MSPNGQSALRVAELPMASGRAFDWHSHPAHQLAWTDRGVLEVAASGGTWVLPPTRALWIPAGIEHETRAARASTLRGVYIDPLECAVSWPAPQPLNVGTMLGALLVHLADTALDGPARARAEALLPDLLEPVDVVTVGVATPADPRARELAEALIADPADPRTLAQWGRCIGASARTLSRAFISGTGITFSRWRVSVRIRAALPMLAEGEPLARVAPAVGYETTSAFVAAFRRETGTTPAAYFRPR